ncbi:hypothetical protein BJY21_001197 [Kineosphaera limosa]|uniref:Uncharacterized protein n=1 Tax=Kineosphaera limosa NBRC 100340 TaxID=1184609 RepID=K6WUR6_9MICO|nr:hypothetical protein [Kineosphaera limosa]NYE00013.1 hypothetical protein [Kineosphaera limosa]GAB95812.1 hypothetical protein KILIM_026_00830 [Kineosphaera limosa NBRC 100340]
MPEASAADFDTPPPRSHAPGEPPSRTRGRLTSAWAWVKAAIGVALGLLPHLVHHIGLLAGVALITGAAGNFMLYLVGLILSIPLFRRLHRRFRTRWAPILGVLAFTAMFALSAFVVGPALTSGDSPTPAPSVTLPPEHGSHH